MSIVIALALAIVAQDAQQDLLAKDAAQHEGYWVVDSFHYDGQDAPADVVKSITRQVTGDHVTWKRDGKPFSGSTLTLDIKPTPKTITIVPEGGQARDKPVKGIYKFDGDKLTLCMAEPGADAPKEFKAAKGSRFTLITLHRTEAPPRKPFKPL